MKALAHLFIVFLLTCPVAFVHPAEFSSEPQKPWTAEGRVTTPDGQPLGGVEIWVHSGDGTLQRTGVAKSDKDGRYSVPFGRGVLMPVGDSNLQVANVTAHFPGYFEKNLNRHGARAAALREMKAEELKGYGVTPEQLFVPGKSQTINFVMAPAARLTGRLLGTGTFRRLPPKTYRENKSGEELIAGYVRQQKSPLAKWRLWLVGKELPPGSSVLASAETDAEGRFTFENVPVGFEWQFQVETHEPRIEPKSPPFRVETAKDQSFELELIDETKELRLATP